MVKIVPNPLSELDDQEIVLTSEDESGYEDDDLTSAFIAKIDQDWQPAHQAKISCDKIIRPVRKAARKVGHGVKIFEPNIGLQASKVVSKEKYHQGFRSNKLNVAISSSSSAEEN